MSPLLTHLVQYLSRNENALKKALHGDNKPNDDQTGFLSRMFSKNKGNYDLPPSKELKEALDNQAKNLLENFSGIQPFI